MTHKQKVDLERMAVEDLLHRDLVDLYAQATTERSHYYTAATIFRCIEYLGERIRERAKR